jgi:hypothetical protein
MGDGARLWLYAVTRRPEVATILTGLSGVDGASVRAVAGSGLVAVVSPVASAAFSQEALARHLEDLDWLAATARAHDAVVGAVGRQATAVPLRLATVCPDERRVRDLLAEHRDDFHATLGLLTGRTEWGVKAYADPESPAPPVGPATSGRDYLARRRAQLSAREAAGRAATERAGLLHEALASVAVTAVRHPPQDRALSGRRDPMVLNGAYLVDDPRAGELAAAVRRLDAELPDLRLELTGPWPPYSFAGSPADPERRPR